MITAKEARKKVETRDTDIARQEQALVENAITTAIQEGKCFVNIDRQFTFETKKWLRSLGYEVSSIEDANQTFITW